MSIEKISTLAREILLLSRDTLLVHLRFLDLALSRLEFVESDELSFATDGWYLAYNSRYVLKGYKSEREIPVRNYLHIIMHCIFRHMYVHTLVDNTAWDLACDIAVEYTITELGLKATAARRVNLQGKTFEELKKKVGQLTAEKIYHYYLEKGIRPSEEADLRRAFCADDHCLWYMTRQKKAAMGLGADQSGSGNSGSSAMGSVSNDAGNHGDNRSVMGTALAETEWKDISERVQLDLETFGKRQGDQAGGLLQNLREVNREKYDYTEFLKKFAVRGEVMKINDDEFDYIFYTYGLKLYEKMPLIEPLEYKEVKRIREFAIAIDTSGSVAGEKVQSFVQKTYNILKSTESFFSKINLHIIQCDAEIQEDVKITSQEEFDKYLKTMQVRGLGGTDFRPVFAYVEELRKNMELTNLKGLIYFTDGYGTFPAQKPDYETAFVFVDDNCNNPNVPPWAIRLILRKNEI